jgi:P pilus assembly chaperone PapD
LIAAALTLGAALPARAQVGPLETAGEFVVSPMSISIAKGQTSGSLIVSASGEKTNHYTVTAYRWTQDAAGKSVLEPTDDLVFFPQAFDLAGGQQTRIRVGGSPDAGPAEQSYRVIVYRVPPRGDRAPGANRALSMGVGLKVSVPVFVLPEAPKAGADVALSALRGDVLDVAVIASGNVHLAPSVVHVVATDAGGKKIVDSKSTVWYTLATGTSHSTFPILRAQCNEITSVTLDLQDSLGKSLVSHHVDATEKRCN